MRIGIDASNLRAGGGVTHLHELLCACDPNRDNFSELFVWGGHDTLSRLPNDKKWISLLHVPALDSTLAARVWWRNTKLPSLIDNTCDLLLSPGGLSAKTKKPCVTMCRNMLPFEDNEKRRYGLSMARLRFDVLKYLQSKSFITADGLIFLTEYARDLVLKSLPRIPRNIAVVPHGVNKRFFQAPRPARRIEECSNQRPFQLLYVSTIDLYKHQWHVIRAVAELRSCNIPIALDLIGSLHRRAAGRLDKAIRLFDPNNQFVRYLGNVPFGVLHEQYHAADAFVYASSCENMPNVVLEAMASGLPIASSNRGPMPEVLDSVAIYFDPESPENIRYALEQLIYDPRQRFQFACSAFKRAQNYSWRYCAESTFQFLHKVNDLS